MRMFEDLKDFTCEVDNPYVELAAEVFSLLSDPTRIKIVIALTQQDEITVGELAEIVGRNQTVVSQHLAKLRWGKIVQTRKEGTRVRYRLTDEHARSLVGHAIFQAEHAVDEQPAHHDTARGAPALKAV